MLLEECRQMDIDREAHFKVLASDLEHTRDIVTAAEQQSQAAMTQAVDRFCTAISIAEEVSRDNKVLESLYFKTMRVRHDRICTAHQATFEWIFQPNPSPSSDISPKIHFLDWLENQGGVYWVAGKPGSGKSTHMKYLTGHDRTKECLLKWAKPAKLETASFHFWNAGYTMQKSQQGLLRSLLYEVLRRCPNLTSLVRASELRNFEVSEEERWSLPKIFQAVQIIRDQHNLAVKFCFFIDGLDEYEGEHNEIIEALNFLTASSNVKLCVSTRPWNVFEDAYGRDRYRKLYLQDLTRGDIEIYTRTTIEGNNVFPLLSAVGKEQCQELIQECVTKSQGVFLWVFLVARSLSHGLTNGDSLSILQTRLRRLPSDLETYFLHILRQVDGIYRQSTARTFKEALQAVEPMPLLTYSFLDEEDPDFAVTLKHREVDKNDMKARNEKMSRRINGRSKGLLEICRGYPWPEILGDKVEFLHRTVRDFLLTKDMQTFLDSNCSESFSSNRSLSRAYLCLVKSLPVWGEDLLEPYAGKCMFYAYRAELETNTSDRVMLDELESTITRINSGTGHPIFDMFRHQRSHLHSRGESEASFFDVAIAHGLKSYVEVKLTEDPQIAQNHGCSIFGYASIFL